MSKFEELEKKCKKYRRRKIVPLFFLLLSIVAGAVWWLWSVEGQKAPEAAMAANSSSSTPTSISSSSHSSTSKPRATTKRRCFGVQLFYGYDRYIQKLLAHKEKVERLGFDCHIKRGKLLKSGDRQLFLVCDTAPNKKGLKEALRRVKEYGLDYQIVYDDCKYVKRRKPPSPTPPSKPQKDIKTSPKPADKIVSAKSMSLKELEALFLERKSYPLALRIAKSYYDKGDFQKALRWAKRANKIDRDKEEAWILYAKSLDALGKREEAKKILRIFLEYKESKPAKEMLREMQ